MQKKFLGNLFFIILLNLIIKPFYIFGIDVQVQNIVGTEAYGVYFTLLNISFLFNIFLDVGITNYNAKNTSQHPMILANYIDTYFGLKLMLAVPYTILTVGFALIAGYNDFELHLLGFLVLNQVLSGFTMYIRSNFAGLHLFKIDALLSILDRLFLIFIVGSFIYGNFTQEAFKIEWFIYAQTVSYGLTLLIGMLLTRVKIGRFKLKIKKLFSIAILKQSTPFALLILLTMIYTRIDAVMLERMLPNGKEQSGIYAQVFRLLDAVNMFAFLVAGILLPIFARLIAEKLPVKPILQVAGKLLTGTAIVTAIGLAINSEFTISSIYKHSIESSSQAFIWLILCFIPLSISHVFSTLLTANHNLKLLNRIALFGIVFNISLNYYLIPRMEAEGAAIATLTTQSITALTQLFLVLKVFKFTPQWGTLSRILVLVVIYTPTAWFLKESYGNLTSFLFTFTIGLIYLFVLRLFNLKDIFALLRTKVAPE